MVMEFYQSGWLMWSQHANDTKLKCEVALKVLPEALSPRWTWAVLAEPERYRYVSNVARMGRAAFVASL